MLKKWGVAGLLIAVMLLAACTPQGQTTITPSAELPTVPGGIVTQQPAMALPSQEPLPADVNPADEEDTDAEPVVGFQPAAQVPAAASQAPSTQFAGSTPIPLLPIDVTNPPKQDLVFTYATYAATNIGLTFESVAGYIVDDTASDTYVLRQPEEQIVDNVRVEFTFQVTPVAGNYTLNNLKQDLRSALEEAGRVNYQSWQPSTTQDRTLLNSQGAYANYRGVQTDGTIVRGRIHMAHLPGNRLLTIRMHVPAEYNTDYTTVFTRIRSTLKAL